MRLATLGDREHARDLLAAMERHYEGDAVVPEAALAATLDALLDDGQPALGMLLAFIDGKPVGFATFSVVLPTTAFRPGLFVKDIFVGEASRAKGVGRALLAGLAREARERGCARIDWTAARDNAAACALYDQVGARRMLDTVPFRLEGDALARLAGER